jgi:hypothetical protein
MTQLNRKGVKKMMNRTLSLVTLIGLLFIATACNMPAISSVKDCGEDMQCFIEAGENCKPAKMVFPVEFEMMGVIITTTTYQEIIGPVDDLCEVKFRTEEVKVEYTDEAIDQMLGMGLTQEQIDEQIAATQEQVSSQEGLDEICRVDTDQLTAVMEQWSSGTFSTDDWEGMDCDPVVEGE